MFFSEVENQDSTVGKMDERENQDSTVEKIDEMESVVEEELQEPWNILQRLMKIMKREFHGKSR